MALKRKRNEELHDQNHERQVSELDRIIQYLDSVTNAIEVNLTSAARPELDEGTF